MMSLIPRTEHFFGWYVLSISYLGTYIQFLLQVLRFATELIPATFAVLGTDLVSPFWAVLFYFTLIMFGIAQQLAIWHCVITGIMAIRINVLKNWETTITFFSCACGFIMGLPMATEVNFDSYYKVKLKYQSSQKKFHIVYYIYKK